MSRSTSRFVWFLFGLTGTGKTYLAEQFLGAYKRPVIVPDTMAEFGDYGTTYTDPQHLLLDVVEAVNGGQWAPGGIYVLQPYETKTVNMLFDLAHKWRVPGTYICDELHQYAPSGRATPFLEMIRMGRHASQSIVGITQRPQGVHNHGVEEAGITCFQVSGRAAQYLTDPTTGYMPEPVKAEDLKALDNRQYMLGGSRFSALPFGQNLGDADGSVWRYDADQHATEKVN